MSNEIWFLANYNLYEAKRYFAARFAEAFRRKGIDARVFEATGDAWINELKKRRGKKPDLIATFHRSIPLSSGNFWWDSSRQPFLSMLVDPAVQYMDLFKSKYGAISCVDYFDCNFIKEHHFENVFFLGHAVERELSFDPHQERPYDVVFIGSSYDPETLREFWHQKLPEPISSLLVEASDLTLSEAALPHWKAIERVAANRKISIDEKNLRVFASFVDVYTRGLDRIELIKSIKNASVHIFGGAVANPVCDVRGWSQLLSQQSNVTFHPAIPFKESLEVLKKSKICLNSMPFFKNGTHERLFTGLACGALPLTTDNLWIKDHFVDGQDLLTYVPTQWETVNDKVDYYLANEEIRRKVVDSGRAKVMQFHTWDNRAEELMKGLDSLTNWPPDLLNI